MLKVEVKPKNAIKKELETFASRNQVSALLAEAFKPGIEFDDYEFIESFAKSAQYEQMRGGGDFLTKDEALITAMCVVTLQDMVNNGLISEDDAAAIGENFVSIMLDDMRVFHKGNADVDGNPYYKNIKVDAITEGRFSTGRNFYHKYELFHWNAPRILPTGDICPCVGTFDRVFRFPVLKEGNRVWMSVSPSEIFSMQPHVDKAHGRVLTLGCGLGYFAYMVSEKDEVESVTVVERSPEVITLFEKHILPQFAHKEKVKVVQADAFEFVEGICDGDYDFCFADIWDSNTDTVPYLHLKAIAKAKPLVKTEMAYWVEDNIIASMFSMISVCIFAAMQGMSIEDVIRSIADIEGHASEQERENSLTRNREVLHWLGELLGTIRIETKEDLHRYETLDGLKKAFAPNAQR